MNNNYIPVFEEKEIKRVREELNPEKSKACNNNILFSAGLSSYSGKYSGYSLKRSNLTNTTFKNAEFDHTSFCGSIFNNVTFKSNCKFESVDLKQSIITNVYFEDGFNMENCSFSNSYINKMHFDGSKIRGAHFDNCYFLNCTFNDCEVRSTMFDGAVLTNCAITNSNMLNLNIEFSTIQNCDLSNTTISYFQLPYIIGIFSETNNISEINVGTYDKKTMSFKEYIDNINDAIIYFTSLNEYFPMANLYYIKGNNEVAYNCILEGINIALQNCDIRMIENYCKLGQTYDLLSVSDIKKILKDVDLRIEKEHSSSMYNLFLAKSYHLKGIINQNQSKSKLEIVINTYIDADDFELTSMLCSDIDNIISNLLPNKIITNYQISHNSPFEICLTCIGCVADLIGIAGALYQFFSIKMKNNKKMAPEFQNYIETSNKMFIEAMNNQFELFEQLLKNSKRSEFDNIIKEFRGKIITTSSEQINKDFALIVSQNSEK